MTIISGIGGSDAIQIIGIVLIAVVVLLIIIGVVICCCSRNESEAAKQKHTLEAQKRKYAPALTVDQFGVLVFSVPHWPQLVEAAQMHACGADTRLKQLIAKTATQHGAYYVVEGDNASSQLNRKIVVSKEPAALLKVASDVFATTSLTDFSNNIAANQTLSSVYTSRGGEDSNSGHATPWSGLELLATLHFGVGKLLESNEGDNDAAARSGSPILHAEGAVVDDAFSISDALHYNKGHCALTATFMNELGKSAPPPSDRRLTDLTPEDISSVQDLRTSTIGGADQVALIKKFALPPANTKRVPISGLTSGRASTTPYTAVMPLTPMHTSMNTSDSQQHGGKHQLAASSSSGANQTTLVGSNHNATDNSAATEDAVMQRIQERRQNQQQQKGEVLPTSSTPQRHPNEVVELQPHERPQPPSKPAPPKQPQGWNTPSHATNQLPVDDVDLDDVDTDAIEDY